ncbi:MAG: glycosyltransferase family 2 protein [Nitrospirota bacterium]
MKENFLPVSAVIITRNEERNIKDCLESARGFDEIVVVDAFSEDRTVEICRDYTDRIYQQSWQGFSRQKQIAVDHARNIWILILDADERVTPGLFREIQATLNSTQHSGFYIPRKNYFLGKWIKHSGWWPDYTLRLFRKDVSRLDQRAVHEKVVVNGSAGRLSSPLEHYTYRTISDYLGKMEVYSSLAAEEMQKERRPSSIINMIINPAVTFLKMFFIRQGFRDGIYGFVLAVLYSYYTFIKYAKNWEQNIHRQYE